MATSSASVPDPRIGTIAAEISAVTIELDCLTRQVEPVLARIKELKARQKELREELKPVMTPKQDIDTPGVNITMSANPSKRKRPFNAETVKLALEEYTRVKNVSLDIVDVITFVEKFRSSNKLEVGHLIRFSKRDDMPKPAIKPVQPVNISIGGVGRKAQDSSDDNNMIQPFDS